jgi:polyhydroxybutyrate depolymerase
MKIIAISFIILIESFALFLSEELLASGEFITEELEVDGITRRYRTYLPTSYEPTRDEPYSLLLAFHGRGPTPTVDMEAMTSLSELAEKEEFVLVYPYGMQSVDPCKSSDFIGWNDGEKDCDGTPQCKAQYGSCRTIFDADDTGFVDELLDTLLGSLNIDPNRVFSTGFSSGAVFSYVLACLKSDRIRAFAPVSGYLPTLPNPMIGMRCDPPAPIILIDFSGSIDPAYRAPSTIDISKLGVPTTSCQGPPEIRRLDPLVERDERTVDHFVYPTCTQGSQVHKYLVNGGFHAWPGGDMTTALVPKPCNWFCRLFWLPIVKDLSTKQLSTNQTMWNFFKSIED